MTKTEFIENIAKYVKKYAPIYGIKVHSPIIAQAILESNWGESSLSARYHNYFGLKCGSKWTGKSVNLKTKEEYSPGTLTTIRDNFRVYSSMEEGVKGYFEFIQLDRYQNLKGITDPQSYLETIKADGYATSTNYALNCMNVVRQYSLIKYDPKKETEVKSVAYKRSAIVQQATSWIGCNEANGSHKKIIDVYNAHKPLARGYAVKYTDEWCATFVSACAIKCGYTAIIPTECSCYYMIEAFKKLGCWKESDSYVPSPGDIIMYDWEDSGSGDCAGTPNHVGIVEKVQGNMITVIEGNYSEQVRRRSIAVNGRFIRGYCLPKYTESGTTATTDKKTTTTTTTTTKKTVAQIAAEVIDGKWGNGDDRKKRLKNAGYDPAEVQAKVNQLLGVATPKVESTAYYKAFNNVSIVNGLNSIGVDSSFTHRTKIAKANGVKAYVGTAAQNTKLCQLAKQGKLKKA